MTKISDLTSKNPWWDDPKVDLGVKDLPKRDMYKKMEENLDHPLIVNVVGLRRVGKSVLLRQTAQHLLNSGVEPKNIFYFLFDYADQLQSPEYLDKVLRLYLKEVLGREMHEIKERVYILLDEIQYIDNWQAVLKRYYDLTYNKIKFYITGSQSLLLANRYKESLAGRIFDYYLPPLSFREFLALSKSRLDLTTSIGFFDAETFYNKALVFDTFHGKSLYDSACAYMVGGQFPGTIQLTSTEQRHAYIVDSVMGKVIDDCIKIFDIDKTDEFKLVAKYLLNNAGSLFEPTNIGREMGLSLLTVNKYIEYLKESHLFEICYRYHKSLIKRGRLLKKLYTTSVNFTCALNYYKEDDVSHFPETFGKIAENMVYNVLSQIYPEKDSTSSISFWRRGKEEIDFLITERDRITKKNKQVPLEVKFTNNPIDKDFKLLATYVEKEKSDYGIVVTKDTLAKKQINGQTVYFIPFYLCLLAN